MTCPTRSEWVGNLSLGDLGRYGHGSVLCQPGPDTVGLNRISTGVGPQPDRNSSWPAHRTVRAKPTAREPAERQDGVFPPPNNGPNSWGRPEMRSGTVATCTGSTSRTACGNPDR